MTNLYPRESVEFQPVTVLVDGVAVTTGVTFCVTPPGVRPVTFTAPTTLGGKIGVMVTGFPVGVNKVWGRVVSAPETPLIECGEFIIT